MKIEIVRTGDEEQVESYEFSDTNHYHQNLHLAWYKFYGDAIRNGMNPAAQITFLILPVNNVDVLRVTLMENENMHEYYTVRMNVTELKHIYLADQIIDQLVCGDHLKGASFEVLSEPGDGSAPPMKSMFVSDDYRMELYADILQVIQDAERRG